MLKHRYFFHKTVKLRLMGSSSNIRGRVEVFYSGAWGRVCGSSWDLQDGKVVCRMLGYSRALATGGRSYGKGDGPIWMSSVHCTGTEKSIAICSHTGWGIHSCSRDNDAWVICSNTSGRYILPFLSLCCLIPSFRYVSQQHK